MCGIVGGVAERNIINILIEGLKRLEYRGYDSAGVALINQGQVLRERRVGKVVNLEQAVNEANIEGSLGIPIHVGQRMANPLKTMHIHIFPVQLRWCITVSLRTIKNSKMILKPSVMSSHRKQIPKWLRI